MGHTIANLFRNRGHQRLWLLSSILWIVVVGWFLWKDLPQFQSADVSQLVSDQCEATELADIYAAGEKAYQSCLVKLRAEVDANANSILPKLSPESFCSSERTIASINFQGQAEAAKLNCISSKMSVVQARLQPETDRATERARTRQLISWGVMVFLPPIFLPIGVALLLYLMSLTGLLMNWIAEGYRRK